MINSNIILIFITIIVVIIIVGLSILDKQFNNCGVNFLTGNVFKKSKEGVINDQQYDDIKNKLNDLLNKFDKDREIQYLIDIQNSMTRKQRYDYSYFYDEVPFHFKSFLTEKEISNHLDKINCIILKLKYDFAQKRPCKYSKNIKPINLLSAISPRYPSGHTTQYYYLYLKILEKFPNMLNNERDAVKKIADKGAFSRLVAGVHFPTDNVAGKMLAEYIHSI